MFKQPCRPSRSLFEHAFSSCLWKTLVQYLSRNGNLACSTTCKQISGQVFPVCVRKNESVTVASGAQAQVVFRRLRNIRRVKVLNARGVDFGLMEDVVRLDLERCACLDQNTFINIIMGCSKLVYLNVAGCESFDDVLLGLASKKLPGLRALVVDQTPVTDAGVCILARTCKDLFFLDVSNCKEVTDYGIEVLAEHSPGLEALIMENVDVSDFTLELMARRCPRMTDVNMSGCVNVTNRGLLALTNGCKNLKYVNINGNDRVDPWEYVLPVGGSLVIECTMEIGREKRDVLVSCRPDGCNLSMSCINMISVLYA